MKLVLIRTTTVMYLTLIIPNSTYLPDNEKTPALRLCSVPVDGEGSGGVNGVRNALAFEYSEEAMGLCSVAGLLESFEEGVCEADDKTYDQFEEAMVKPDTPDFRLYRWLKQAIAYSPTLECFLATADSADAWD